MTREQWQEEYKQSHFGEAITMFLLFINNTTIKWFTIFQDDFMSTNPNWLFEGDIALDPSRKVSTSTNYWTSLTIPYVRDSSLFHIYFSDFMYVLLVI